MFFFSFMLNSLHLVRRHKIDSAISSVQFVAPVLNKNNKYVSVRVHFPYNFFTSFVGTWSVNTSCKFFVYWIFIKLNLHIRLLTSGNSYSFTKHNKCHLHYFLQGQEREMLVSWVFMKGSDTLKRAYLKFDTNHYHTSWSFL